MQVYCLFIYIFTCVCVCIHILVFPIFILLSFPIIGKIKAYLGLWKVERLL